jgi:hypothetical protein
VCPGFELRRRDLRVRRLVTSTDDGEVCLFGHFQACPDFTPVGTNADRADGHLLSGIVQREPGPAGK